LLAAEARASRYLRSVLATWPRISEWRKRSSGADVERRLGSKAVIALEYNGAHGVHLYDLKNVNEIGGGQVYLDKPIITHDPADPTADPNNRCSPNAATGFLGASHVQTAVYFD